MIDGRVLLGALAIFLAGPWRTAWSAVDARSPVVISEFMGSNSTTLADEDGDYPDWIELRNRSDKEVSLDGWFLTDGTNPARRWRLPATNLVARGFLVVFASGKDRSVVGRPLHTQFRLDADNDYLALVQPDGTTVATEFAPTYPRQLEDVSYGTGLNVVTTPLVARGDQARYFVPRDASLGGLWTQREFDDSGWKSGSNGLGFADPTALSGSGLLAYWPIQEGAGDRTANSVNLGTAGSLSGVVWAQDPERGVVLDFNGRNSYVAAGTIPRVGVTSNFTWSFWYRQRSVPNGNAVILGNRSGGGPGLQFIKFTPTHFEYYHDGDIGFIAHNVSSTGWHHLAVVKRGQELSYYDNGTVVGTSRAGGDIDANPFYFGGDPGAPGEYVDGLIDDVSLWSDALSSDQIKALREGTSPSRFGGLGGWVTTDIGAVMRGINSSAYFRMPFQIPGGAAFNALQLRLQFDDGFVASLNGTEVARRNAPAEVTWNSSSIAERSVDQAGTPEVIDLTQAVGLLTPGTNVMAIQVLNQSANDGDLLVLPELEARLETALGPRYFAKPTPGGLNDDGFLGMVADVVADRSRGFYDGPIEVGLACETPDATIRYTLDGTEPAPDHGTVYSAPVSLRGTTILRAAAFRPGYRAGRIGTWSFLFLDQVLTQTGAGFPTSWGTDWQMDPRVVNAPSYSQRIRDDMKSLPVVSIALDSKEFWGPNGIYTQSTGRGDGFERACSAELFFPDGSEAGFQVNCGVQIVGGASRALTPKHGIGLTFKRLYGPAKLKYPFFKDSAVDAFDFIAFRPNFNMSWVRTDGSGPLNNANADGVERLHAIYVRDAFTKESQLAMGQPSAHQRFVHLYINGLYWGVYNPSERTDASFAAAYLGGEKEQYDAIFSDPSTVARAHDGDKIAWAEMMTVARQGVAGADAYARIQQYLDVTNLADYMMLNFYCATVDWPWQNWNAARKREDGAQFRFFIWDADYTLETAPWVPEDRTGVGAGSDEADSPARLYHELRKNAEWRMLFADRVQLHCFNQGALTTNQTIPRFLRLCDTIDGAIVGESARWGDVVRRGQPYTRNVEWLNEKTRLLTQFFPKRTEQIVQQFIRAGLYPAIPATVMSHSSGTYEGPVQLSLTAPVGTIYFTTNGLDPRLPGGGISPEAKRYEGPLALSGQVQLLTRTWRTNAWSALNTASFVVTESAPPSIAFRQVGSTVVLSWPSAVTGFELEQTTSIAEPQWTGVASFTDNTAVMRLNGDQRFFRLRKR
ncbi:MAG: chitobiase/beta-hexosaminidase C-terminal domain-containing protein [Verrucomicrobiales bacterium]|nr:chitobiase/beta-hexosaminidase C-terminal domain-containing protein [Verrucomicrobiales bacterium]